MENGEDHVPSPRKVHHDQLGLSAGYASRECRHVCQVFVSLGLVTIPYTNSRVLYLGEDLCSLQPRLS